MPVKRRAVRRHRAPRRGGGFDFLGLLKDIVKVPLKLVRGAAPGLGMALAGAGAGLGQAAQGASQEGIGILGGRRRRVARKGRGWGELLGQAVKLAKDEKLLTKAAGALGAGRRRRRVVRRRRGRGFTDMINLGLRAAGYGKRRPAKRRAVKRRGGIRVFKDLVQGPFPVGVNGMGRRRKRAAPRRAPRKGGNFWNVQPVGPFSKWNTGNNGPPPIDGAFGLGRRRRKGGMKLMPYGAPAAGMGRRGGAVRSFVNGQYI
jgi:hypothetical protein